MVDWSQSDAQIAARLQRTVTRVRQVRHHLERRPKIRRGRMARWLEVDWRKSDIEIAAALSCSRQAVHQRRAWFKRLSFSDSLAVILLYAVRAGYVKVVGERNGEPLYEKTSKQGDWSDLGSPID